MIKIIVDSNIIFSALLNINSHIGQILINGKYYFDFYAPEFVRFEIFKHKERISTIGKLSDNEFIETYNIILKNITILNHSIIPAKIYKESELICRNIDIDDTIFVAVAKFTNGTLWTGDNKLLSGLAERGIKNVINTHDLYQEFLTLEKKKK